MQKIFFFTLFLFFQISHAQHSLSETEKLATTAKVWGFLKYYHPNVASGKYDWDKELFTILPQIEKAKNKKEFSEVIEKLINTLGIVEKCSTCNDDKMRTKYFYKNLDLSWLKATNYFSKTLSSKLEFIKENRYQGPQFYVHPDDGKNAFAKNENYEDFDVSNRNARLLALFRYWNIVEYFFPNKYLMDVKWDVTLNDMLPVFIGAKSRPEFKIAVAKLVARLNDSHAAFAYTKLENLGKERFFFPVEFKIINQKMVVSKIITDSLAVKEDLRLGDAFTKLNGKTIRELLEEERPYISASNESVYNKQFIDNVACSYAKSLEIEFIRDRKTVKKTLSMYTYRESRMTEFRNDLKRKAKTKFFVLDNNIGYVNMATLKINDVTEMVKLLDSTKAIVFDMRNYPNGTNFEISKFLNSKERPFVKFTKPDFTYPGRYYWSETNVCGSENPNNYKGKVVILVNEFSLSQSEWATMCLQTADNAIVIGSQTAGADGNVSRIDFIKDWTIKFSGIGVFYPDGRETQRIGIVPDIEAKPTILGLREGKDEVLERAIQFIKTGK